MEWNGGKLNNEQMLLAAEALDSDDDEIDSINPLQIIAQSRNTVKLVKVEKPAKSLITEADLADIESMKEEIQAKSGEDSLNTSSKTNSTENGSVVSIELVPHAINMIKKEESTNKAKGKHAFKPFRTTISDVHNVDREKQRLPGKNWEVTAATPPILRNNAVKLISLQDSIEMERQHKEKILEEMEKQAEDRLSSRKKIIADNIALLPSGSQLVNPNSFFQSYRQREEKFNEYEDDDEPFSGNSDDGEESDTHGISIVLEQ